jgi:geranylgeranyl diphosphate synthase, type II
MYAIEELQNRINKEIERRSSELSNRQPAELYSPVSYSLEGGGKEA